MMIFFSVLLIEILMFEKFKNKSHIHFEILYENLRFENLDTDLKFILELFIYFVPGVFSLY
jgi:hypothetical protein